MEIFSILEEQIMQQGEQMVRIFLASILGLCIGFERRNRNKMAGVRTHSVVAFGAALMMVVSKYGFVDVGGGDASRVAAQIVSGIGFLGAGIIFVRNNNSVSGLTTAAGIWATAGVGMAAGAGQYFIAVCSTVLLVILQILLHRVSFLANEAYRTTIKVIMNSSKLDVKDVEQFVLNQKISILEMKVNKISKENTKVEMDLLFQPENDKADFISRLADWKNVISVRG